MWALGSGSRFYPVLNCRLTGASCGEREGPAAPEHRHLHTLGSGHKQACPRSYFSGKKPKGGVWIPVLWQNASIPPVRATGCTAQAAQLDRAAQGDRQTGGDEGVKGGEDAQVRQATAGTG